MKYVYITERTGLVMPWIYFSISMVMQTLTSVMIGIQ